MIVQTRALVVHFPRGPFRRRFAAVAGLDLEIREGDFFALLGRNGAGKTTAMHCLLGLIRPTSGEVLVLGQRPERGAALFRDVAYLPEEPRYPEYLTVLEAVTYYARLSGVAAPAARVADILDRLGLGEHRKLAIRRCSKGMKQKVGIAQCLVHQPRLVFLDEPMRGLDPMTVHLFREMLVEMNRKGATIVMNSHLLTEVELVANRVAIIDRGRRLLQDAVAGLLREGTGDYIIQVANAPDVPPLFHDVTTMDGITCGRVKAAELYDFMDYARARGLEIVACAREKPTLEDGVLAVLRRDEVARA